MLTIVKEIGKFAADCKCSRCGNAYYVKNKYGAKKSPVGDLCLTCKTAISSMVVPTQEALLNVFNYDKLTGKVTHKNTTLSGTGGELATYNHVRGYLNICIGKTQYLVHRVIFMMVNGHWPTKHIDHINHMKQDNRWENLREVAQEDNNRNMPKQTNSLTGVLGVSLHKPTGKYRAYISVKSKAIHLGLFESVDAAKTARAFANAQQGYHANHGE